MKTVSFQKPSADSIRQFRQTQATLDFSYSAVGATATVPPAGYVVDHTRIKLGVGEEIFESAKVSLRRWEHFNLGWVEAIPNSTPIENGQVIAVLAHVSASGGSMLAELFTSSMKPQPQPDLDSLTALFRDTLKAVKSDS